MGDGILSLHLINRPLPSSTLPPIQQLQVLQIVKKQPTNTFKHKSCARRWCRGGGGGAAAAAMMEEQQQQQEGRTTTTTTRSWISEDRKVWHKSREARQARRLKLQQAMRLGAPDIVIDLEFSHLVTTPQQLWSLMQQVKFCYGANAKAAMPCRLSVTGCTGIVADELGKVQGSQQWFINKEEQSWLQVFEKREKTDLVYLTADSPNLLRAVDPAGVYIVGGIVDRNQWKGTTLMKAINLGISHAKLPIGEHLKLTTSEVLTVNQVVEVLLRALELQDLQQALLQAIPLRKRKADSEAVPPPPPPHHDEEEKT